MHMKKLLLVLIFTLLYIPNIYSQSGWFWQNPIPQGNDLLSVSFCNPNTGFAVGNFGAMIKTTDKGESWNELIKNSIISYSQIKFTDENTGYLLRIDNKIFKTTNSGANWYSLYSSNSTISNFSFCNSNTGIILINDTIYKTSNGGINWYLYFTPAHNEFLYGTFCKNDSCIYLTGRESRLLYPYLWFDFGLFYYTTNNGLNWNRETYQYANASIIESITFIDDNFGFMSGTHGFFSKTTNGGINWVQYGVDSTTTFSRIYFINQQTGYLFCDAYPGFKTINGGLNWTGSGLNNANCMCFNEYNNIVAVQLNGGILKSTNSGSNFTSKSFSVTSANLITIQCVSDNVYYAGGNGGTLIKTTNGGKYWFNQQSGINNYIKKIKFTNENVGGAISPLYIIHTTNGGNNWITQKFNNNQTNNDILFLNENTGFVVGSLFLKTTDGGDIWNTIAIDTGYLAFSKIYFLNQQTGYLLGNRCFKTTNSGINWVQNNCPYGDDMFFTNQNNGYIVGGNGSIYRTTNAGINWISCTSPTSLNLKSITFLDENTGYIVGSTTYTDLLKTTNSGLNWYKENLDFRTDVYWLNSISSINNSATFVGAYGIIKSTRKGSSISIKDISTPLPSSFSLFQNYPNPFNPTTSIKYQIKKLSSPHALSGELVQLKIYDILGKVIETLVNEKQSPGTYEVTWDGSNYPSGVYFYKLTAGDFVETKKMILIK